MRRDERTAKPAGSQRRSRCETYKVVIRAERLSKSYPVFASPRDRLRQLLRRNGHAAREHAALRDVTFDVAAGETLGVIGQNGSGKSTLLQLIAGTLAPTTGSCEVRGRVAALLELGAGFNLEFTGRENVRLSGSILGLSSQEIRDRYASILDFSEIGELADRPVKTYSTGMYLRLAFALAVSVDPDVLLVDEILAVGDVRFQLKCIERMRELQRRGTTIVFVSHSIETVRRLCRRCLWLEAGRLQVDGDAIAVTDRYVSYVTGLEANGKEVAAPAFEGQATLARIRSVALSGDRLRIHGELRVAVEYEVLEEEIPSFLLGVAIFAANRTYVFGPNTALDGVVVPATPGRHRVDYVIPRMPLLGGSYSLDVGLFADRGLVCLDYRTEAGSFAVEAPYVAEGLVHIEHAWETAE
jgi:ABC-type polysaccharide/polyol phosphate transport system ATPase subunit